MLNSKSALRRVARGGLRRRPSASMTVAMLALFVALSGGAYAAVTIPAKSIGAAQLKSFAVTNPKLGVNSIGTRKIMNAAVTYAKIKPSSVGDVRIVKTQVQERVKNVCPTGQAISAVDDTGTATCVPASSAETNTSDGSAVAVNSATTAATVSTLPLAAGSAYTVQSAPYITVTPSTVTTAVNQHVVVTCTLTGGTAAAQRSVSFDLPPAGNTGASDTTPVAQVQTASIPLTVVAPSSASATNATVTCTSTVTDTSGTNVGKAATNPATVTAQGATYATQLSSATTATTTTAATTTTTTPAP